MLEKEPAIDAVLCGTPDHLHAYVSVIVHAGRQAHVLRETADTQRLGSAASGGSGQANGSGHADGQHRPFQSGHSRHVRMDVGWGHRSSPRSTRLGRCESLEQTTDRTSRRRHRRCRPESTGICGSAHVRRVRTIRPTRPSPGAISGTSAVAVWRDFGCHDLDAACWALDLAAPTTIEARPAGNMDATSRRTARSATTSLDRAVTNRPST